MAWKTHEIHEVGDWNARVLACAPRSGAFLSSWEWGEFQRETGKKVTRLEIRKSDVAMAWGSFISMPLPAGMSYIYCPRGPVGEMPVSAEMLQAAARAIDSKALFVRFDYPDERFSDKTGFRAVKEVQPSHTLILSLGDSEEDLLAGMHSKTRYNIRLATRKGVEIRMREAVSFSEVQHLFETTAQRGGFRLHGSTHYEKMLHVLNGGACRAFLATAVYEGKTIAANIMVDFGNTRTYLHGASGNKHRNVMAPYLLHWELIKDAKEKGVKFYDWWGVAPEGAGKEHDWYGITRFKLGFGGERVGYPGTFDVVRKPVQYHAYRLARKVLRR